MATFRTSAIFVIYDDIFQSHPYPTTSSIPAIRSLNLCSCVVHLSDRTGTVAGVAAEMLKNS